MGEPKPIDYAYMRREAERLQSLAYGKRANTDEDIRFILQNIEGQVKGASDTAKKYKDIIANQQISKEEAQQIYDAVKDRVEVTPIGELPLKGKEVGVFIYQVDDVK